MSEIIKTSDIPREELEKIYESRCEDLKKEYDKNLALQLEVKRLKKDIESLNTVIEDIYKKCRIHLRS